MQLKHKEYACPVSPEVLSRAPRRDGLVLRQQWREIAYTDTASQISLSLFNVNEEAALGGYCSLWVNPVTWKFTWADLDDVDCLRRLMQFEPLGVFEKATSMLARLQEHRKALVMSMTM